jgi:hypothetical protein
MRSILTIAAEQPEGDRLAADLTVASGGLYLHRTTEGERLVSVEFAGLLTSSQQTAVAAALKKHGAISTDEKPVFSGCATDEEKAEAEAATEPTGALDFLRYG